MIQLKQALRSVYENDILKFDNLITEALYNRQKEVTFKLENNEFQQTFEEELKRFGYTYTINEDSYKIDLSDLDYNDTSSKDYIF